MKFIQFKYHNEPSRVLFKNPDVRDVTEFKIGTEVQNRAGVLSEYPEIIEIESTAELPVGQPPGVKLLHMLSRDDIYGVMPDLKTSATTNDDAVRDLIASRISLDNVNSRELVLRCKNILLEAVEILEQELEIGIPKPIKKQIEGFTGTNDIVKFIKSAQGLRENHKGPIICGLLKIADCLIAINNAPELEDLINKTAQFENDLYAHDVNPDKDNQNHKNRSGFIEFMGNQGVFNAREVKFDTKSRSRIVSKLMRKVGFNVPDLVRDGVRCRIVIPNGNRTKDEIEFAQIYVETLPNYNFKVKPRSKSNSAGNANRDDIVLIGTIPDTETSVEVVIQSDRDYLTHEHGIKNHEPYEWIQNFQVICRLWGSVGQSRYERKLKELSQTKHYTSDKDKTGYTIALETLQKAFGEHFYFNSKTKRFHWYEYDFRTNGAGIFTPEYQNQRNEGTIRSIADRAREYDDLLGEVSFNTWSEILENNSFPDPEIAHKLGSQVIHFLNSVRGVPKLIVKALEVQLASLESESDTVQFSYWEIIFSDLGFPETMSLASRGNSIKILKNKDAEAFKFLIRILKTKLETGEVIEMMK